MTDRSRAERALVVRCWIQLGCERRETAFVVTPEELRRVPKDKLHSYIEEAVVEWLDCRYGWGWSCTGFSQDYGFLEDADGYNFAVVASQLNPNTKRLLVPARTDRKLRRKGWIRA